MMSKSHEDASSALRRSPPPSRVSTGEGRPAEQGNRWGKLAVTVAFLTLGGAGGCDLSVTNPGPVEDRFLDTGEAHEGMVNGMGRALSDALNWVTLTGGAVGNEITGAGNLVGFGINLNQRDGRLVPTDVGDHWDRAQRARWTAEHGIERMREETEQFGSYPLGARALLFAGYANRLLGENFCDAVIDGGPREPRENYLDRALEQFSEALSIAEQADVTEVATAARAGRASVHMWRGDWEAAVADAQEVPTDFAFEARMSTATIDEYNRIVWAVANAPFRTISVINTFYNDYYEETGDSRTPWDTLEGFPFGDAGDPPVPFHRQRKYIDRNDGIPLSAGSEMRLIEAEALLHDGDWEAAMDIINERRVTLGVPEWPASNADEAWMRLKRERGIELWLEGRRLGDLWRWRTDGTPGANPDDTGQDACFPIAQSELDTNPNL